MDKALKQRLVGASVILILAVIVLPMLFSGRADIPRQKSQQISLPSKPEELSFDTRRFPIGDGTRLGVPARQPEQAAGSDEKGLVEEKKPVAPVSRNTAAGPAPQPAAQPSRPAVQAALSANPPRYLVQVASFSSEKRANDLAGKLIASKLSVVMDVVDRDAGRFHRVRVGPFTEHAQATTVAGDLQKKFKGLRPRVLDLRPHDSAPVSIPSDPLVRWVVQVGSFTGANNASALQSKLQQAGYTAYTEKVTAAQGSIYKVRIGPEIRRKDAVALAARLKSKEKIDGIVMTME